MAEIVEIIISGDASNPVVVVSGAASPVTLIEADTTPHNSALDLQGGGSNEFYHLTSGQYSFISGLAVDKIDPTNDVVFEKSVTVSGTLIQGTGYNNYLTGLRVISDGSFSVHGDAQVSEFILKTQTTDDAFHELEFANATKKLSLPDNTSWYFKLRIIAKDTNNNTATFNADGAIKKGISAGFTEIIGNTQVINLTDEISCQGIKILADTAYGYLKINVAGKTGTTVRWVGYLNLIEVR